MNLEKYILNIASTGNQNQNRYVELDLTAPRRFSPFMGVNLDIPSFKKNTNAFKTDIEILKSFIFLIYIVTVTKAAGHN